MALKGRADALYVCVDALLLTNRIRINTLARTTRLPMMTATRDSVEVGGLISYGPNFPELWRRAGDYVDKILRGAKRDRPQSGIMGEREPAIGCSRWRMLDPSSSRSASLSASNILRWLPSVHRSPITTGSARKPPDCDAPAETQIFVSPTVFLQTS